MVKLVAKSAVGELLPVAVGSVALSEIGVPAITSISTSDANREAARASIKEKLGVQMPKPGRTTGKEGARAVWFAPGKVFWLGIAPKTVRGATLTDQSDAWTILRLEGPRATDVLARLTPIDLRPAEFKKGHTARTLLGHMSVSITRVKENTFDIMVFRSMSMTAVHEIDVAMRSVAAQYE